MKTAHTFSPRRKSILCLILCLILVFSSHSDASLRTGMPRAYAALESSFLCNRPSGFVSNQTSNIPVWVLYTRATNASTTECDYSSEPILPGHNSNNLQDGEAIWVRCQTNEYNCNASGLRPFKLGSTVYVSNDVVQQYLTVRGTGNVFSRQNVLSIHGISTCPEGKKCGWVREDDTFSWPGQWNEEAYTYWPAREVIYDSVDTSDWTCTPFDRCIYNRSPRSQCVIPNGLFCAEYYDNATLSGDPFYTRNEATVNQNWGVWGPDLMGVDNFSVLWQGRFNFNQGDYTFTATADDGIRVYLDNTIIIDEWRGQPPTTFQRTIPVSGGDHTIKVEYFEGSGGAVARVNWQQVQGQVGCPTITAWKGEYWSGYFNDPVAVCRNDNNLSFDWGTGSPDYSKIPSDNFTARWTRTLSFAAGRYRFHLAGDDGFSLRVDDRVIIDEWIQQPRTEYTGDIDLSAGSHNLKVEYFEASGGANISLWWEGPLSSPGGSSIDPNKVYRIIAVHSGKGLDVNGASPNDGARVQQWTYAGGANQKWRFEPTGDGYYMIRAVHSNKCLDVQAASPNNGAIVQQWTCASANNQRWQVTADGNAFVIRAKHSGKALDVEGARQDNGTPVHQWDYGGGANQRWLIEAVQ